MKRKLFALLIVLALFLSLPVGALAAGASLVSTIMEESEDVYDIAIEALGVENASMMQFSMYYDASALSVLDVQSGKLFEGNRAPVINGRIPGKINLVWASLTPLSESGIALVLRVQKNNLGDTRLSFDPAEIIIADADRTYYDVSCADCILEGTETPSAEPAAEKTQNDLPDADQGESISIVQQSAAVEALPAEPVQSALPAEPVQSALSAEPVQPAQPMESAQPASSVPSMQPAEAPRSDDINEKVVSKGTSKGLTMNESQATVSAGETKTMTIVEDEPELIWSSSNEQVATVDDAGVVTTFRAGTAVITASTLEGDAYASSVVTVEGEQTPLAVSTPKPAQSVAPSAAPTQAPKPAQSAAPSAAPTQAPKPSETPAVSPAPTEKSAKSTPTPTAQPSPSASPAATAAPAEAEKDSGPVVIVLAVLAVAAVIVAVLKKKKINKNR